ncbi:uncharacterized protein LOC101848236 isoform X1 [Aplysia californica]|uniref:Uncharacterized protein LOC101848236 isoform X1 n=1 Tax=Aplysia californica TaxID=6500 RepID=A0ABM1W005_APLCA|nr:uncharacterized protein LOC101848236 isoform X1 [Aplysia californica]
MSAVRVLLAFLLVLGLTTPSRCEEQIWRSFSRYRRQTSGQGLGPTEEGTSISRTCAYNTGAGGASLTWEVQLAAVKRAVATCVTNQVPYNCTVSSGFSSLFTVTTDQTQATLTWNADRRFLSLSCSQFSVIASWTLVTYSKPTDLTCRSPEITNNDNTVSVTCVSSDIFPQDPRCVLYRQTDGGSRVQTSVPPSYGTDTTGSVSGPSCTFTIQASELGAGTHSLSVNMYPQFDGSGENYGVNRAVSPDVTFYYPVPEIVNCPSGAKVSGNYIMSGSTATCECRQKTEGFPAGTVVLSQGGSTLGSGTVVSGNINNPGNNNNDQTLTCRSESSLGQAGPSVSKTVKFAYGPNSATLTFSPTSPSSLCQGTSLSVVSTCTVGPSTVNPQPDYKISVNGTPVGTSVQQTLQLQRGAHNVRCRVENSLFPTDLFTDVTEMFIVRVLPPDPPEISVSQSSVLSTGEILVKENVTTGVQCVVRGGYPATSDVRLSCPSSQVGSSGVSSVVVTRSQVTQCSCTATHDSGCYNKRSDVTIKAAYGPEGVTLERKNVSPGETGTYNLCPSVTPDITMECSVGAVYPAASFTLTMTSTGTQTLDTCTGNNNKCSYNFVPTRGGNHEFRCGAVNSAFGDLRGDIPPVQVYVREPPKTAPTLVINGKTFTGVSAGNTIVLEAGTEHSVECHVDGGLPEISASDISLQCGGRDVTDGKFVPSLLSVRLNETSCSCRAEHPSGCYDLGTEVIVSLTDGGTNGEKLEKQCDDQEIIAVAVGAAVAAFVLGFITAVAVYCVFSRKGWLPKNFGRSKCGNPKEKQELNSDGLPYEFSDLRLSDTAHPNQQDDKRRGTRNHTEASTTAGRQEESPYVDMDSVQMSSQDVHTPVLIGRTMAEIITPDATQTDGDGGRYNNVLVTSPVSRAAPGGQGQTHNPGTYDIIADPAREAFAHPYMRPQPDAEYSNTDEMDGPSSSLQNNSTGKGTYVNMEKTKKPSASPYANVNDNNSSGRV